LLVDRFRLVMHRDSKDMAVYALVIGKGGHKLHEAPGGPDAGWELVNVSSQIWSILVTPVVDMTGLTGRYDNPIHWREFNDPEDPESAIRAASRASSGWRWSGGGRRWIFWSSTTWRGRRQRIDSREESPEKRDRWGDDAVPKRF
jgi:hypothetical protein